MGRSRYPHCKVLGHLTPASTARYVREDVSKKDFKMHFQHAKKMHELKLDEKNLDRFGEDDANIALASSVGWKSRLYISRHFTSDNWIMIPPPVVASSSRSTLNPQ